MRNRMTRFASKEAFAAHNRQHGDKIFVPSFRGPPIAFSELSTTKQDDYISQWWEARERNLAKEI